MHLNPDTAIEPEGFIQTIGIDEAIWFRFKANTDDINNVFDTSIVDTKKFTSGYKINSSTQESWWDASEKNLTGNDIKLPNVKYMRVGYLKNQDESLTVYIMWFET